MKKFFVFILIIMFGTANATEKVIAESALSVSPLLNGQEVPDIEVKTSKGEKTSLAKLTKGKNTVLFFYRGGWCPYCNTQLGQLKKVESDLKALGYQLIGVSTDSVDMLKASVVERKLDYLLVSDFNSEVSKAFGLAFFASEKTSKVYRKRLDLKNPLQTNAAGEERLVLPVPAVYMINEKGLIEFNYVNPNFKVRLDEQLLLAAAKILK